MQRRRWMCEERGCNRRMGRYLDPALLLLLKQSPAHGYTLLARMPEFELDYLAPTVVYRALRQMEDKGWVSSTLVENQSQGPPRRVYSITALGREILDCCMYQLRGSQQIIEYFLAMHNELSPPSRQADKPREESSTNNTKETNMRLVIPSEGENLDAQVSSIFGRSRFYIFTDTESMDYEVLENPAVNAAEGAGVQAAQTVLQKNIQVALAPNLGPNAYRVFQAAGVKVFYLQQGSVKMNIDAYKAGQLQPLEMPGPGHVGRGRRMRQVRWH